MTSFLIYIYFITYKKKMVNFYSSLNLIENGEFNLKKKVWWRLYFEQRRFLNGGRWLMLEN